MQPRVLETTRLEVVWETFCTTLVRSEKKHSIAVARSSLARQDIRNCRQVVCDGEWWAASLFFLTSAGMVILFPFSRSVGCYSDLEEVPIFFGVVKIRNSLLNIGKIPDREKNKTTKI